MTAWCSYGYVHRTRNSEETRCFVYTELQVAVARFSEIPIRKKNNASPAQHHVFVACAIWAWTRIAGIAIC